MAPSPSTEPAPATLLATAERDTLLDLAEGSIRDAFAQRRTPLPVDLPGALEAACGVFVSLHVAGALNGCIGSVTPTEPLAAAVTRLARSAAFDDPRLPPLRPHQLVDLEITISILSPMQPIPSDSRTDVLELLLPGVHGLVLRAGHRQALFLPEVWHTVPEGEAFLDHLLHKAGLQPGTWPAGIEAHRFRTETFRR